MKTLKNILIVCFLLVVATINSCDKKQSGNVVAIKDLTVSLYKNPDITQWPKTYNATHLDYWKVEGAAGSDIYSAAFGFVVIPDMDDTMQVSPTGVRIDVSVVGHDDDGVGGLDLWSELGHVAVSTPDGLKVEKLDIGDPVIYGRIDANKEMKIFVILGDPDLFKPDYKPDNDYLWDNDSKFIFTQVKLKIELRRRGNEVIATQYIWARFVKGQYGTFFDTKKGNLINYGVVSISKSGIGNPPLPTPRILNSGGSTESDELMEEITLPPIDLSDLFAEIPNKGNVVKARPFKPSSGIPTSGLRIDSAEWDQYGLIDGEWKWASAAKKEVGWFTSPISAEPAPSDPNGPPNPVEIASVLEQRQPYAFFATISLSQPRAAGTAKMVVKSLLDGKEVSKMFLYFDSTTMDGGYVHYCKSNFLILTSDPNEEGYHNDVSGNRYTVLYCPKGGYVNIYSSSTDVNLDGKRNLADLAEITSVWQSNVIIDSNYDSFYEFTEDPNQVDGIIDLDDLLRWIPMYLHVADPNQDDPNML